LVMLDVDHFKSVNDRFGHAAGDCVLISLANVLRRGLRSGDPIGRWGGDELVLLLGDVSEREAQRLVERLQAEFSAIRQGVAKGSELRVTFTAGVAAAESWMTSADWHARADEALYHAKREARGTVRTG